MKDIEIDIIQALLDNDFDKIDSLDGLLKHRRELRIVTEINFIEILEKKTSKFFLKMYIMEDDKWNFFDYGWLNVENGSFYTHQSKLLIFNINNIFHHLRRRDDSENHIYLVHDGISYLLYHPFPEVIELLFIEKY